MEMAELWVTEGWARGLLEGEIEGLGREWAPPTHTEGKASEDGWRESSGGVVAASFRCSLGGRIDFTLSVWANKGRMKKRKNLLVLFFG